MIDETAFYILEKGEPKRVGELLIWAFWFEANGAARHIGSDQIGKAWVSTVFVGVDMNWRDTGPPLLFETRVFGGPLDGEGNRYATTQEAIDGHTAICARVHEAILTGTSK